MKTGKKIELITLSAVLMILLNHCVTPSLSDQGVTYPNPVWAPPYYPGVRYYYLPDIETYYDLSTQEFVFLEDGQWYFSPTLPPFYAGYDLSNAFIIALDQDVYQPWMHHQFYVSNYPRYYYRSIYDRDKMPYLRGFNENERKPLEFKPEEREKIKTVPLKENAGRKYESPRAPQKPNYYGKNIGKPVKIQPQMRERKEGAEINRGRRH